MKLCKDRIITLLIILILLIKIIIINNTNNSSSSKYTCSLLNLLALRMCWPKNTWAGTRGRVGGIWGWGPGDTAWGGVRRECGTDSGVPSETKSNNEEIIFNLSRAIKQEKLEWPRTLTLPSAISYSNRHLLTIPISDIIEPRPNDRNIPKQSIVERNMLHPFGHHVAIV